MCTESQRWTFSPKPDGGLFYLGDTHLCLSVDESKMMQQGAMAVLADCRTDGVEPSLWNVPDSWVMFEPTL